MSTTTPAASHPRMRGVSVGALGAVPWCRLARTFVSTGFTETARTATTRSRGPGVGAGASKSTSESGSSMGSARVKPTAFIEKGYLTQSS